MPEETNSNQKLNMSRSEKGNGEEWSTGCGDMEAEGKVADTGQGQEKLDILYSVHERPPVVLLIILALQQFLTMFGATFSFPILMARFLCMEGDTVGISQLISTVIFVAGLSTIIQTTVGVRLPIIQSVSYGFVTPFIVLLSLPEWKCQGCVEEAVSRNETNITCGSDEHVEMWQARLRELQGALLVSSVFQVVVGFTGLVGVLLNFIGPLTIAPTIAMIGLSLFDVAAEKSQGQWWISITTLALVAIFSQYMRDVSIPFCEYRQGSGWARSSLRLFALFPVLLAIGVAWLLCYILTAADVFPSTSEEWGYLARTDVQSDVISKAPWFRFPYPGQWGMPTVSAAGVLGSLAAIIASIVESVGDYYACARLSGAPPPPGSAVSRGIGVEGLTCLLAGAWGSGGGTTSYSENIGAIGITKVGSLAVIQASGVLMIIMGCVGKFSAIFVTIPEPIIGGLFLAMFGMVTAVGISNLQYVDLNSSRNLFILGVSLFLGLSLPKWLSSPANANVIDTGSSGVDNIFTVLCSTSMFVAGVVAFFLDNTIPGTREERGLSKWRQAEQPSGEEGGKLRVYDLPWIQPRLNRLRVTKRLPFCPGFINFSSRRRASKNERRGREGKSTPSGMSSPLDFENMTLQG
ncbi:solute carrier family 23 member 1-like isoform X1 [Littorina saxatilis]|uniref:solute carrier family 23 member 1-like isoform X1 n=1 Tax=Littorina saxatilis TaxID=31220 RepID=UPI0038B4A89A